MTARPSATFEAVIEGVGWWSAGLPDWPHAAAALRGEAWSGEPSAPANPSPAGLAPAERRRASDSVLLALQAAEEAVAASGHPAQALASVFTSAHGDLPITDALCTTLASDPRLLSPLRFHHSVHNAPSGYWAIAQRAQAPSTALSAGRHSFAHGLLEALMQGADTPQPILLVAQDTEARGALASVNTSRGRLGLALVLAHAGSAPARSRPAGPRWQLSAAVRAAQAPTPCRSAAAAGLGTNAMADALPLFEALARTLAPSEPQTLVLALDQALCMELQLRAL